MPREVLAGRAERGPGEKRVTEQGGELEQEAEAQQAQFDTPQLGPRAAEAGDERQHEEVQHDDEGEELEREPEIPALRVVGALDLRQFTGHQPRMRRLDRTGVARGGVEGGCVHAECAGRPWGYGRCVQL